jgi:hypothetical protein
MNSPKNTKTSSDNSFVRYMKAERAKGRFATGSSCVATRIMAREWGKMSYDQKRPFILQVDQERRARRMGRLMEQRPAASPEQQVPEQQQTTNLDRPAPAAAPSPSTSTFAAACDVTIGGTQNINITLNGTVYLNTPKNHQ